MDAGTTTAMVDAPFENDSSRSSSENDDEKGALLPWEQSTTTKRSQRYWRALLWTCSHVLVSLLTYLVAMHLSLPSCVNDEHLSAFMSGIDRGFHEEIGNAATAVSTDPNNPDADNRSWNNFTVTYEVGGDNIEDWWLDLGTYTAPVLVPEKYAKDFNFDANKHAMVRPDDPRFSPGDIPYVGYPASPEVTHKLHCLNFLRQAAYFNHEYYRSIHSKPWSRPEHDLVRHLGHCVDVLRQKIICEVDMTLVPFEKSNLEHARNDWSQPRKCRNFASAREWLAEHQWNAGDAEFHLDDHHHFGSDRNTVPKTPKHSYEELWRGY